MRARNGEDFFTPTSTLRPESENHAPNPLLPEGLGATIDLRTWERPVIFRVLAAGGPVEEEEMRRTFNLGVGLVAVVSKEAGSSALAALTGAGERAWPLGEVIHVGDVPFEERVRFVA